MQTLMEHDGLVTGIIYQNKEQPSYQELIPGFKEEALAKADLTLDQAYFDKLVQSLCKLEKLHWFVYLVELYSNTLQEKFTQK